MINNNLFLHKLKSSIKIYAKTMSNTNIKEYKEKEANSDQLNLFFSSYCYICYSINVLYSKEWFLGLNLINLFPDLIKKYNFSWSKNEEKINMAQFLLTETLVNIDSEDFYIKYCERIIEEQEISITGKNKNFLLFYPLKILTESEIAQLLMMLIYEPMINHVNQQKDFLIGIFNNYDVEEIKKIATELNFFSHSLIPTILNEKTKYFGEAYSKNTFIEIKNIKISNPESKLVYAGLREVVLKIFPKQVNVKLALTARSPICNAVFTEPNINFKEYLKLIIKSKNWAEFIKNVRLKGSKFMIINNIGDKLMMNLGFMIVMYAKVI